MYLRMKIAGENESQAVGNRSSILAGPGASAGSGFAMESGRSSRPLRLVKWVVVLSSERAAYNRDDLFPHKPTEVFDFSA